MALSDGGVLKVVEEVAITWVTYWGTPTFRLFLEKTTTITPTNSGLPPAQSPPAEARPAPRKWPPCGLQPGAAPRRRPGPAWSSGDTVRQQGTTAGLPDGWAFCLFLLFVFQLFHLIPSSCQKGKYRGTRGHIENGVGFLFAPLPQHGDTVAHQHARGLSITPLTPRALCCCEQGECPGGR